MTKDDSSARPPGSKASDSGKSAETGEVRASSDDLPDLDRLRTMRKRLIRESADLPTFVLTGAQRKRLSCHVFAQAAGFVGEVAAALTEEPELFAHLGIDGQQLGRQQDRATLLVSLAAFFQRMADYSRDRALFEQVDTVKRAMFVVRQVRGETALPVVPPGAEDRQEALLPAEKVLTDRQQRIQRLAKREKLARRKAAQGDSQPAPARPRRKRQAAKPADPFVAREVQDIQSGWISDPPLTHRRSADPAGSADGVESKVPTEPNSPARKSHDPKATPQD